MAKLLIVTDVAPPQVNGVLVTYDNLKAACDDFDNIEIEFFDPNQFKTIPLWFYREIHGIINPFPVFRALRKKRFDAVHIATEGPIGLVARLYYSFKGIPFTTAHHTRIPMYLEKYLGLPQWFSYGIVRWFHNKAKRVFVIAKSGEEELSANGVKAPIHVWKTGINLDQFETREAPLPSDLPRPIFAYCGRVSIEKDIHEFLELDLPGSKLVVGDGPHREELEKQFPEARFVGYQFGKDLADYFATADVFVFPSKSETLGLVVLESISSGTPVAAYDVNGPKDSITPGVSGFVGDDLRTNALACLDLDRKAVAECAEQWNMHVSATDFLNHLAWIDKKPRVRLGDAEATS